MIQITRKKDICNCTCNYVTVFQSQFCVLILNNAQLGKKRVVQDTKRTCWLLRPFLVISIIKLVIKCKIGTVQENYILKEISQVHHFQLQVMTSDVAMVTLVEEFPKLYMYKKETLKGIVFWPHILKILLSERLWEV